MAIVKVKLMEQYQRKDGTHAVVIYVYEIKPQYVGTGYHVRPEQFKDEQDKWIRKHPDAVIINARIEDKRREVLEAIVPGVGYVHGYKSGHNNGNFCDYIRHRGDQYGKALQEDMRLKCYRLAFELAQVKGRDIYAHEIDADFIREFRIWCQTERVEANGKVKEANKNNTVMRKIKNLRYLYNQAIKDKKASAPNPFNDVKLKFDKVPPKKLTREQVQAIEVLPLTSGTTIDHARNAFLISFYCQGMRFEKVCLLKWEDVKGEYIEYENNKGSKPRSLKITPQLRMLLDKYKGAGTPYILPFLKKEVRDKVHLRNMKGSANAIVNEFLKIIGDMAGIPDPLHFHRARHAFAYIAKKRGVLVSVISDSLGHSDAKITEDYLDRLDDDFINDAVSVVWE